MHTASNPPFGRPIAKPELDRLPGWKRAIDIVCCLAALPILALSTVLMTVMTKVASPGPIFFRQERVGYRGRRFMCYKFRTMRCSADTSVHQAHLTNLMHSNAPMMKMDSHLDSRLIPGAWLLRASGLDELPQIINILRGEMSVVGPRPCVPYEYEQYLPWQMARFDTLPGLTGLWQVSGKNRLTFEQMILLDIQYARNRTLWRDMKIIFLTLPALLLQIKDTKKSRTAATSPATPATTQQAQAPVTGTFH
jgi:exopolysaccharide production protein ExoY